MLRRALPFLAATLFVAPIIAFAAIPSFGPIFPANANQCAGNFGLLMQVVNNLISVLLTFAIVLVAPLMIAWAGFLFVANPVNPAGKEQAKKILLNTVVGIVIALCGYLIVDAIMVTIYNPDASAGQTRLGTWYSLLTTNGNPCINLPESFNPAIAPTTTPSVAVTPGATDEASVRARLAAAGVTINNAPCPTGSNGLGCTNVGGMQQATIQQIINIADACGGRTNLNACNLVVTGGTEPGHAAGTYSHGNGYKVDIRPNSQLDAYLESGPSLGTRTGDHPGPAWTDSCRQNQYVRESDHWDITVKGVCGGTSSANKRSVTAAPQCTPGFSVPIPLRPGPGLTPVAGAISPTGVATFAPLPSGTIGYVPLPQPDPPHNSGKWFMDESSESPFGGITMEATISQCQGDIDPSAGPCYYHSQISNFNEFYWTTNPDIDPALLKQAGVCSAAAPGPWYVNMRWTYSACNSGEGRCGFVVGWYDTGNEFDSLMKSASACIPGPITTSSAFGINGGRESWVNVGRNSSISFAVPDLPSGASGAYTVVQNTNTPQTLAAELALTTCAGDFNVDPACKTFGSVYEGGTVLPFNVGTSGGGCQLSSGGHYYISLRNVASNGTPTCDSPSCSMMLQLNTWNVH